MTWFAGLFLSPFNSLGVMKGEFTCSSSLISLKKENERGTVHKHIAVSGIVYFVPFKIHFQYFGIVNGS